MAARPDTVPPLVGDAARSYVALGLGFAVAFVLALVAGATGRLDPDDPEGAVRGQLLVLVLGYTLMLGAYQLLTWWRFRCVDGDTLAGWAVATRSRPSGWRRWATYGVGGRGWSVTAAFLALVTVIALAALDTARADPLVISLSLLLVAVAWGNVVVASAVAYLREDAEHGGLEVPGAPAPTWSDLVYLSVQISTTFSTSDVEVTSARMRRLVTAQSLVAFVFNTVIVAVLVSSLLTLGG